MVRDERIRILKNLPVGLVVYKRIILYKQKAANYGKTAMINQGQEKHQIDLIPEIKGIKLGDDENAMIVMFGGNRGTVSYDELTCDAIIVADKLSPDKLTQFSDGVKEELFDLNRKK